MYFVPARVEGGCDWIQFRYHPFNGCVFTSGLHRHRQLRRRGCRWGMPKPIGKLVQLLEQLKQHRLTSARNCANQRDEKPRTKMGRPSTFGTVGRVDFYVAHRCQESWAHSDRWGLNQRRLAVLPVFHKKDISILERGPTKNRSGSR